MPDYQTDGRENLRADPSIKHQEGNTSPAGSGKDAGGTDSPQVTVQVKTNPGKSMPTGSQDNHPDGIQSFTDSSV